MERKPVAYVFTRLVPTYVVCTALLEISSQQDYFSHHRGRREQHESPSSSDRTIHRAFFCPNHFQHQARLGLETCPKQAKRRTPPPRTPARRRPHKQPLRANQNPLYVSRHGVKTKKAIIYTSRSFSRPPRPTTADDDRNDGIEDAQNESTRSKGYIAMQRHTTRLKKRT